MHDVCTYVCMCIEKAAHKLSFLFLKYYLNLQDQNNICLCPTTNYSDLKKQETRTMRRGKNGD